MGTGICRTAPERSPVQVVCPVCSYWCCPSPGLATFSYLALSAVSAELGGEVFSNKAVKCWTLLICTLPSLPCKYPFPWLLKSPLNGGRSGIRARKSAARTPPAAPRPGRDLSFTFLFPLLVFNLVLNSSCSNLPPSIWSLIFSACPLVLASYCSLKPDRFSSSNLTW